MASAAMLVLLLTASVLLQWAQAECEPATCGNLTVKYPFWLGAPSQTPPEPSCGPPAFELWCAGNDTNTTSASMRGSAVHVLRIDYGAGSFVASHTRVAAGDDGVCRTDFNMSSSLALSPFRISAANRALCFLYNCNGTEPPVEPGFVNATGCGRIIYAYLGGSYDRDTPPAIQAGSCTYAYLPALGSEAATETAADYGRMLKAGFLLDWGPGAGIADCDACVASGGGCRYSNASAGFACLCAGGRLRDSTCAGSPLRSGANLEPGRRQPSVPPVRASTPQRTGGLKRGSRSPSRCDVTLTPLSSWYTGRFGRKETQEFLRMRNTQLRRFLMASGTISLSGDLLA